MLLCAAEKEKQCLTGGLRADDESALVVEEARAAAGSDRLDLELQATRKFTQTRAGLIVHAGGK